MDDFKTVEDAIIIPDPLIAKKKEDVEKMRASLLACNDDPITAKQALQTVTVLRVYHQLARIIKYLDMMDKIEEKLYESLDKRLDTIDTSNPTAWVMLINMQERLQKNITESHKLLQPYLELQSQTITEFIQITPNVSEGKVDLDSASRDRLRTSAQQVLIELQSGGLEKHDT